MFALFALIALVSARDYVALKEPEDGMQFAGELDTCYTEFGEETLHMKFFNNNGAVQVKTFSDVDCKTETQIEGIEEYASQFELITEIPRHLGFEKIGLKNCNNAEKGMPRLILEGCNVVGEESYKYILTNRNMTLVKKEFADKECKTEKTGYQQETTTCEQCVETDIVFCYPYPFQVDIIPQPDDNNPIDNGTHDNNGTHPNDGSNKNNNGTQNNNGTHPNDGSNNNNNNNNGTKINGNTVDDGASSTILSVLVAFFFIMIAF